ncbi:hypothetical protein CBR_g3852 [Chara braunii]|uniref:Reverse transcriptase zinc-binding domain-containing protein n=1 Tax=Chara braunii TaxID=69332 RepID=A0A388KGH6_CHABU|nr:hypothetical protein CBR_g3852 [Chara braunii]|eukprot:GBG69152.1 hypothetical protein CBR_g3852 [Chara braunii]
MLTGAIADDLLLTMEATTESMQEAKSLLDSYVKLSEAQVNWGKSIYFLPADYETPEADWGMQRVPTETSERYLGLQVSLTNARPKQQSILRAKTRASIQKCRVAVGISLVGRALLLTSAVFAQLWHIAAVCLLNKPTAKLIASDAARYLWKPAAQEDQRVISKCVWHKVTARKSQGGLGIIDPYKQNLALLTKWLQKAVTQAECRTWQLVLEYLLQHDLSLARKEDVWATIFMDSFRRRQLQSHLAGACWTAWRVLIPPHMKQPTTRDEVLRQILFDNSEIRAPQGDRFAATAAPGAFSRRWTERSVTRIEDLWDEGEKCWRSVGDLKLKLRGLPHIAARRQQLISAIPKHWQELLAIEAPTEGEWYLHQVEGNSPSIVRIMDQLDDETWEAQEWSREDTYTQPPGLRLEGTIAIRTPVNLQSIRIHTCIKGGVTVHDLIADGTPLRRLRVDPQGCYWEPTAGSRLFLHQFSTKLGRTLFTEDARFPATVAYCLNRQQLLERQITEQELRMLWDQLPALPSQKLSGLLWLLSHAAVPTSVCLFERGMDIDTLCKRCDSKEEETLVHLFWACPASKRLWQWWERHWLQFVGDLLPWDVDWALFGKLPSTWFKHIGRGYVAQAIRSILIWTIWEDRNSILFKQQWSDDASLIARIKAWIRAMTRVDWNRKAAGGQSKRGRHWFLVTWARDNKLAAVTHTGKLVISPWLWA